MPLASEDFLVGDGVMSACEAASLFVFFKKKKKPARVKEDQERWSRLLQFKCHFFFFLTLFFNIIWVHFYFYEI